MIRLKPKADGKTLDYSDHRSMIAKINYHISAIAELILALVRATDDHRSIARQCRNADEAQARNCPPARADATRDLSTIYRLIDRTGERDLCRSARKGSCPLTWFTKI